MNMHMLHVCCLRVRCIYGRVSVPKLAWFSGAPAGVRSLRGVRGEGSIFRRIAEAGKPMPHILLVSEVRADWPAMCEVLGFRTWAHAAHPCFLCSCDKAGMCDLERRLEWIPFTPTDYLEEAAACTQEHTHIHIAV
jgi:hypothetical protein